ncbi:MAG: type 4a pilus biogenesis protein PilO [Halanaerobacter sp.]
MNSWSEVSNVKKTVLVILVTALILTSFYLLLYRPKADDVKDINNNLDKTISDIKNNKDVLRRKEELKQEYQAALDKLEEDDQDQPIKINQKSDLVVRINELMNKTDVNLKTMESIANKKTDSQKYGYTKMPIAIEINGGYDNILKFINQIEELKYLIKVDTLNVNSNLKAGLDSGSTAEINAQIKLVAFATDDAKRR